MLDFTKLWDKIYLFGPNPASLSRSDLIFFWIALVFVTAGIVAKVFALREERLSPKKILTNKFYHLFLTTGLLVLIWTGLRFENIPWLGTHIVVLGLFLIWLVWLGFIGKYYIREFKHKQQLWQQEKIKQKYLK